MAYTSMTSLDLLRHTVATLAYRTSKAVRGAPPDFAGFRAAPATRTPGQILAHMGDLFDWALSIANGKEAWHDSTPLPWEQETARFFAAIEAFDRRLASDEPPAAPAGKLFQGPIADGLKHVGQLAMLRRMSEIRCAARTTSKPRSPRAGGSAAGRSTARIRLESCHPVAPGLFKQEGRLFDSPIRQLRTPSKSTEATQQPARPARPPRSGTVLDSSATTQSFGNGGASCRNRARRGFVHLERQWSEPRGPPSLRRAAACALRKSTLGSRRFPPPTIERLRSASARKRGLTAAAPNAPAIPRCAHANRPIRASGLGELLRSLLSWLSSSRQSPLDSPDKKRRLHTPARG
jgi:hypothetical protein